MSDDFALSRLFEKRSKLLADFLREHQLAEPKSVEYRPLVGCIISGCFRNVDEQVAKAGGRVETGWAFMEIVGVSIYTISHAIWVTAQGKRIDITPWYDPPKKRVLFLPDERVAIKRGYISGYRTVFETDPRLRAVAFFEGELDKMIDDSYDAATKRITPIKTPQLTEIASRLGIPWEIAVEIVQTRLGQVEFH